MARPTSPSGGGDGLVIVTSVELGETSEQDIAAGTITKEGIDDQDPVVYRVLTN